MSLLKRIVGTAGVVGVCSVGIEGVAGAQTLEVPSGHTTAVRAPVRGSDGGGIFGSDASLKAVRATLDGASGRRSGRDSVLDGLLIGAGIGALLGLIPDHYDDCEECHDSLWASIAVGAGAGLVIDAVRGNRRPSAPSDGGAGGLAIAASRKSVGVQWVRRWR